MSNDMTPERMCQLLRDETDLTMRERMAFADMIERQHGEANMLRMACTKHERRIAELEEWHDPDTGKSFAALQRRDIRQKERIAELEKRLAEVRGVLSDGAADKRRIAELTDDKQRAKDYALELHERIAELEREEDKLCEKVGDYEDQAIALGKENERLRAECAALRRIDTERGAEITRLRAALRSIFKHCKVHQLFRALEAEK